jgi:hypothetical protein
MASQEYQLYLIFIYRHFVGLCWFALSACGAKIGAAAKAAWAANGLQPGPGLGPYFVRRLDLAALVLLTRLKNQRK